MPLGYSFYVFRAVSYFAETEFKSELKYFNPFNFILYLVFFAQIPAGPIARWEDTKNRIFELNFTTLSQGLYRFIVGFCKKIFLADTLNKIAVETFSMQEGLTAPLAWLGAITYGLVLYYDFSGYSDMAIGISNMFGYSCPENFNYPYMARTFGDFWHRWHITLGGGIQTFSIYTVGRFQDR